jgi:hypothetical protein
MPILKRRSHMVSFRLSEAEYAGLKHLCQDGAARSISELARGALQKLVVSHSQSNEAETVVQVLQSRVDALDLEVKRLANAISQVPNGHLANGHSAGE